MKEKNFKENIKDEELFLSVAESRLNEELNIPDIEEDLISILKSKTLTSDNTEEIFTYLNDAEYNNTHYFDGLKDLILNTEMTAIEAIDFMEQIKLENDYMFFIICKYISKNGESQEDKEVA